MTMSRRTFGVEIEFVGASRETVRSALTREGISASVQSYNHVTQPYWKIVTDGSLSNYDAGEAVSPVLQGEAGIEAVTRAARAMEAAGATANRQCGLHVHIDVRDATAKADPSFRLTPAG